MSATARLSILRLPRIKLIGFAATFLLVVIVCAALLLGLETASRFRSIKDSWLDYARSAEIKGTTISVIRGELGYGGFIHVFKNYVLRQQPELLTQLDRKRAALAAALRDYRAAGVTAEEEAALVAIEETIARYVAKIPIARRAAAEGWPPERTDRAVKVDDHHALNAFKVLDQTWRSARQQSTGAMMTAVREGENIVDTGLIFLPGLAVVAVILYFFLDNLVGQARRSVARLSEELTERQKAERAARKLSRAVEQSPATIIMTDSDGRIEYVNPKFVELTEFSRDDAVGRTPGILSSGSTTPAEYAQMWRCLRRGEEWRGIFRNRKKSGEIYWAQTTISPLKDTDGRILNYISVGEDITERKRAQAQIELAQKMEAIGVLAGGVAHDFNNILTAILGNVHLARLELDDDAPVQHDLQQIEIAGRRARDLVKQILTFSRRQPGQPRSVRLSAVVEEVLNMIRASIPTSIAIDFHARDDHAPCIHADPTQIHQVVMNLCRNAVEAIGAKKGRIDLLLAEISGDQLPDTVAEDRRGRSWLRLTVTDSGCGMEAEMAERVFDPFFTTKPVGKGTGLGLSVVQRIVAECGGAVQMVSQAGRGSTFSLFFPAFEAEEDVAADDTLLPRGSERILLVDDQEMVVAVMRRILASLGYQAEAYTHSRAALKRFAERPGAFDLVITDLVMPELTGDELIAECRAIRPDIPVILCTAYRPETGTQPRQPNGVGAVVSKPIDPNAFPRVVRRVLDADRVAEGAATPESAAAAGS